MALCSDGQLFRGNLQLAVFSRSREVFMVPVIRDLTILEVHELDGVLADVFAFAVHTEIEVGIDLNPCAVRFGHIVTAFSALHLPDRAVIDHCAAVRHDSDRVVQRHLIVPVETVSLAIRRIVIAVFFRNLPVVGAA